MTPVTIQLPNSIQAEEARFFLAIKLYELGRLSCGQAAELAGYSKGAFMELLGKARVPLLDVSLDELATDVKHAG